MANTWVEHIKKWSKDNNMSYGCALSNPKCKEDYAKMKKGGPSASETLKKISKMSVPKIKFKV